MFGAAHFIYIWEGDILFSYAVAALVLMIVLYGRPKPIDRPSPSWPAWASSRRGQLLCRSWRPCGGRAARALPAQCETREHRLARCLPLFSFLLLSIGSLVAIAAAVFWLLPDGPVGPRVPLSVFGPLLLVTGWLSWKYYEPAEKRSVRMAVSLYVFVAIAMTTIGARSALRARPDGGIAIAGQNPADAVAPVRRPPRDERRASATSLRSPVVPPRWLCGVTKPMKKDPADKKVADEAEDQGRAERSEGGAAEELAEAKGRKGATSLHERQLFGNCQVACGTVPGKGGE